MFRQRSYISRGQVGEPMAPLSIGTTIIAKQDNYSVVPNVLAQARNVVAQKVASLRGYDVVSNHSTVSA